MKAHSLPEKWIEEDALTSQDSTVFFFDVLEIVKTEFQPKDSYLKDGVPTFIIPSVPQLKGKVERLRAKLKPKGLEIIIRRGNGDLFLQAVSLQPRPTRSRGFFRSNLPLLLFILTIITVTISGYLASRSYIAVLKILGRLKFPDESQYLWELTALYVISIMGAVGLHEVGHIIACRIHHVEASLPIFIPGIPGITPGTFGAVIIQKEPTLNRDQLFDIGMMGPLVGFIVSLVVSVLGYSWSEPVSMSQFLEVVSKLGPSSVVLPPALLMLLSPYLFPQPDSFTHFLHPVAIAGWMGTLITFLNAFPIGQLDGGHVSRAVLGKEWHSKLSYIMAVIMIFAGWWTMALLVIFFLRAGHPGTLDDVSDLSRNRKIAGLLLIVIFVSCFTLSPESPLWSLIFR